MKLIKMFFSTDSEKRKEFLARKLGELIYLKTGHHIDISLQEFIMCEEDGKIRIHVNADVEVPSEECDALLEKF